MDQTTMEENAHLTLDRGSIPTEESNNLRLQHLIKKVGTEAVRVEFDKQQEQRDLLQPRTGSVSSADFDITLMMVFFRHLTPLHIGNKLPVEVDTSTAADLTRITYFRNKRAHSDSIDDKEFEEAYSIISKVN
ncbi:unnamed protein product [Mytilus coruscus]|uniref:DZIP3-like HEPN domain-containing protein n=1 Tax=Mytilus coruscus TaxID=42192 RepID=A0A6J8EA06_MYTCO|nr:unnamed protein product [Mytilus coruscus]